MTLFNLLTVKTVVLMLALVCYNSHGIEVTLCGPRNVCECSGFYLRVTMDCTARHVKVRTVCQSVKEYTNGTIVTLKVGENNAGVLHRYDFKGCEGIQELDIHDNQMQNLSKDMFSDFSNLTSLDLRLNSILSFYDGSLENGTLPESLKSLCIGGNVAPDDSSSITQPSYPDLSNLKLLEKLFIDGFYANFSTAYRSLNVKILSLSTRTKYTYCFVDTITDYMFEHFTSIENLNLSACSIKHIEANAFAHLTRLRRLDLSLNRYLGFDSLSNIAYGLQYTQIQFLNISSVYPTFGLSSLILKRDMCYFWNTTLEEIALDSNGIIKFETNAVIMIPLSMKVIRLNDNSFTFGPYLSQLGCGDNLTHFEGNLQNSYHNPREYLLAPSTKLDNSRNLSSDCPFMTDEYLKRIASKKENCAFLRDDDFVGIFKPSFPKKLKELRFHDCQMTLNFDVDYVIRPADNDLVVADFSGNNFFTISGKIGPFPNIKYLDLSKNYCSYLGSRVFNEMITLENLQLSQNYLGEFFPKMKNNNIFSKLVNLRTLNLSSNHIRNMNPKMFTSLVNLTTLDLNTNNLENIKIDVSSLPNLISLNISVNAIRTLPLQLRQHISLNAQRLNKSFSIDLRNNTIDYKCENQEFLTWLSKHKSHMIGYDDYQFSEGFLGKDLDAKLLHLEKQCRSYVLLIVLSAMGVTIFLSVLIGAMIYRNRWKIRYLLYMSKAKYFGYRRLDDNSVVENYKYDAFISYDDDHIRFILDKVVPILEEQDLSLCIHQRDFLGGVNIADNIIDAIQGSRRTVILLTNSFLKRKWCLYEFNMARMESIYSREENGCLVIVMLEDVPANAMPLEMLHWIKTKAYIKYTTDLEGEAVFWHKLKQAITT